MGKGQYLLNEDGCVYPVPQRESKDEKNGKKEEYIVRHREREEREEGEKKRSCGKKRGK